VDLSSNLTTLAATAIVTVVVLAALGAFVSTAVIARTVVSSRQERISRHESMRTYYGRQLSASH